MADISLYTGIGRLTRDAEIKTIPSGKMVLQFTLASNPSWNRDDPAVFIECQLWGDRGTRLSDFLKKGSRVCVHGTLKQETWTGADGQKKSKFRVDLSYVNLLDGRKQDGESNGQDVPKGYRTEVEAQIAALFGDKDTRAQAASLGVAPKQMAVAAVSEPFQDDIPF
jgi:single-strand DNA-binding protein